MTQLDQFEDRLLSELREYAAERGARPTTRSRTRLVVTGLGVAAAAVVGTVLVPGLGVTPAYSVQEGNAGEIEVEVNRPEDAAGLEAALAEHGIAADITYVADGGRCAPGRYVPVGRSLSGMQTGVGGDLLQVTLSPGTVRDGETFVLALSVVDLPDQDGQRAWVEFDVAAGPVDPCDVIPAG